MDENNMCHGKYYGDDGKVLDEEALIRDGWKKYGELWVKCEYGKEKLSDLLIAYAQGLADLRW